MTQQIALMHVECEMKNCLRALKAKERKEEPLVTSHQLVRESLKPLPGLICSVILLIASLCPYV